MHFIVFPYFTLQKLRFNGIIESMKKRLQTQFSTRQYMLSKDFKIYYCNDTSLTNVGRHEQVTICVNRLLLPYRI